MTIIGAGFNYACYQAEEGDETLTLPEQVSYLELGLAELDFLLLNRFPIQQSWSLHLSRTPMTESRQIQQKYIDFLAQQLARLSQQSADNLLSISIHLTGSRQSGNGLLGGADNYVATQDNLASVKHFIQRINQQLGLAVWLENANFYSHGVHHVLAGWHHTRLLCEELQCSVIFDVAHAVVEANNNDIPAECILGCVPWDSLAEIHLSGITSSPDGSMHDGHNRPVHEKVWELFDEALKFIPIQQLEQTIFTIEHTSPVWRKQTSLLVQDYQQLDRKLLNYRLPTCHSHKREKYMRGYLAHMLQTKIPALDEACQQRGIQTRHLINDWISQQSEQQTRIVFSLQELPPAERAQAVDLTEGFLKHARETLSAVDAKA